MEAKGYKLSIDYKILWDLIHDGHRVPAWIVYSNKYEHPIYDLVEVKMAYQSDRYSIGSRGIGYDSFSNTFKDFEMNCKSIELKWVELTIK